MSQDVLDPNSPTATMPDGVDDGDSDIATVGTYTWKEFMAEHGHANEIERVYIDVRSNPRSNNLLSLFTSEPKRVPEPDDLRRVVIDPSSYLGFPVGELYARLSDATDRAIEV